MTPKIKSLSIIQHIAHILVLACHAFYAPFIALYRVLRTHHSSFITHRSLRLVHRSSHRALRTHHSSLITHRSLRSSLITHRCFLLLFFFLFVFSVSHAQDWDSPTMADTLNAREKRATGKLQTTIDRWLITDFAHTGILANTLVKTSPFLQYPAMNPELGAYLSGFEKETDASIILRAYIDIDFFNPWVATFKGSQKLRKLYELSRAKPAHAMLDIVYSPTAIDRYDVKGYNISLRDSLRTPAFQNIFSDADWKRMRDTLQAAMGRGPVQKIDSAGFNAAIIRALEALKGDPKLKPDPGYRVVFRKAEAGYDVYRWPALRKHYPTNKAGDPVAWIAVNAKEPVTLHGSYSVADPEAAGETPLKIEAGDLIAGTPEIKDTTITLTLNPTGKADEVTVLANYLRTNRFGKGIESEAGQIAMAAYEQQERKLVVISPQPVEAMALQNELNKIYQQALVKWTVTIDTDDFNHNWPAELTTSNTTLSKYSSEMNAAIKAYKKKRKIDNKTSYIFIVPGIAGNVSGYMPLTGQWGFVLNSNNLAHTIAHELGHGPFHLRHTFSEKDFIAAQGTTDNLMDYTANKATKLYKHQWDMVHDPETMLFAWAEDEDEGMHAIKPGEGFGITPSNMVIESYSDNDLGTRKVVRTINRYNNPENYAIAGFTVYNNVGGKEDFYEWKWLDEHHIKGAYLNSDKKEFKVNLKKSGKVYIYKLGNNENCVVYYQLVDWGEEDLLTTYNVNNDRWSIDKLNNHEVSCFKNLFSEYIHSYECQDPKIIDLGESEIKNVLENLEVLKLDVIIAKINEVCLLSLKRFAYEDKLSLFKKAVSSKDIIWNYAQTAALKIMSSFNSQDYGSFITYLTENDNEILEVLIDKIDDRALFFILKTNNYTDFIGAIAIMIESESDDIKWNYLNCLIKKRYGKIDEREEQVITILLSSLTTDALKDPIEAKYFIEMLIDRCKKLSNYQFIYKIAKARAEDNEAFRNFTQCDKELIQSYMQTISLHRKEIKAKSPDWIYPNGVEYTYTIGTNIISNEQYVGEDLGLIYSWSKYLNDGANKSIQNRLNSEEENELLIGLDELLREFLAFKIKSAKDRANFWSTHQTIACDNIVEVLNYIKVNENQESLKKINTDLRKEILKFLLTCNKRENVSIGSTENTLFKLLASFDTSDKTILATLTEIGFDAVFNNLSSGELGRFMMWAGSQVVSTNSGIESDKNKYLDDKGQIIKQDQLLQLESNIFDWRNFSAGKIGKTTITVNGNQYQYNELVLVHVADDFTFLEQEFKRGTVLHIPIIQALAMAKVNSSDVAERSAWLAVDVATLFIGIGELKLAIKVGSNIKQVLAFMDIAGSSAAIVAQSLNSNIISDENRYKLQMMGILVSLPNLASSFIKSGTALDDIIQVEKAVKNTNNAKLIEYFNGIKVGLKLTTSKVQHQLALWFNSSKRIVKDNLTKYIGKQNKVIGEFDNTTEILHLNQVGKIEDEGKIVDILEDIKISGNKTEDIAIMQHKNGDLSFVLGACFVAETPVNTANGFKPICNIEIGDTVLSFDEQNQKPGFSQVTQTFRRHVDKLVRLVTSTNDTLYTTDEHPFMTETGWKPARLLAKGVKLRLIKGTLATLLCVQAIDTTAMVYNFEVDQTHTYTVGNSSIIVHNSCDILSSFRKLLNEEEFTQFVRDFGGNAGILNQFNKGELSINAWQILNKSGSKFVRTNPEYLTKFAKLNPEVQKHIANFTDNKAGATLSKFLDDATDATGTLAKNLNRIDEGIVDAWRIADAAKRTGLAKNMDALENISAVLKRNNLGLNKDGLASLLAKNWDDPVEVVRALKKASDANIPGLTITFKKFPQSKSGKSYVLDNAKQFQKELSGDANLSYVVNNVSFDGIDDAGKLIDRKFGHGNSIFKEVDNGLDEIDIIVHNNARRDAILDQIERQLKAVGNDGTKIKWEISTELGTNGIKQLFKDTPRSIIGLENVEITYIVQKTIVN